MPVRLATLNNPSPPVATPLPSASTLIERLPIGPVTRARIAAQRDAVRAVLRGTDSRLLAIVGPCSLHEPESAIAYGRRLVALANELEDDLLIVMRAYVEKPRTTIGWKGLLHDPDLDGSHDLARGLQLSRELLIELTALGLPLATELLTPMAIDYLEDTLAWAAIGARTTESQTHRERVSGLPLPVGFKNGTDGDIGSACDAMAAAAHAQCYFGCDEYGTPAAIATEGNPDTHLILRGGHGGPNYDRHAVSSAAARLDAAGLNSHLVVDCSHGNSAKIADQQTGVLADVVCRRAAGEPTIAGIMLESNLVHGKQAIGPDRVYGQSITDDCLGWAATEDALRQAASIGAGGRRRFG